mgnify:CR=1 FL=1
MNAKLETIIQLLKIVFAVYAVWRIETIVSLLGR